MCIPRFVPTRESLYDFLVECVFVCLTQHRSYAAPCRFLFTLQGRTARFVGVVGLPVLFRGCFHTFLLRYRISSAVIAQSTRVHISCWQTYSIVKIHGSFAFHIFPDTRIKVYSKEIKFFCFYFYNKKRPLRN